MHHQVTNCAHQHLLTSTDISLEACDVFQCIRSQTVHIRVYRHPQTFSWNPKMFFNALCHKLCFFASTDIHRHLSGSQASLQGVESSHQSHNGDQYTIAEGMSISFVRKCFPTRPHDMTTSPTRFYRMLRNIMFTL